MRCTGSSSASRWGGSLPAAMRAPEYRLSDASTSYSGPSWTSSSGNGSRADVPSGDQTVTGRASVVSPRTTSAS